MWAGNYHKILAAQEYGSDQSVHECVHQALRNLLSPREPDRGIQACWFKLGVLLSQKDRVVAGVLRELVMLCCDQW